MSANNVPLYKKKCLVCEDSKIVPLNYDEIFTELKKNNLIDWKIDSNAKNIYKDFLFKDFLENMSFVSRVADLAEEEGHHPDLYISYNKLRITLYTHSVSGVTENDLILCSKIEHSLT